MTAAVTITAEEPTYEMYVILSAVMGDDAGQNAIVGEEGEQLRHGYFSSKLET